MIKFLIPYWNYFNFSFFFSLILRMYRSFLCVCSNLYYIFSLICEDLQNPKEKKTLTKEKKILYELKYYLITLINYLLCYTLICGLWNAWPVIMQLLLIYKISLPIDKCSYSLNRKISPVFNKSQVRDPLNLFSLNVMRNSSIYSNRHV